MRILIIEDECKIADNLKRGLQENHYQVEVARDGPAGLELARTQSFGLIILDRMLPGLDGLSLLRQLRGQGQRVPVLLLTALDRVNDRIEGLQAGADDYLPKPFALAELLARVEAILRRSRESPPLDVRHLGPLTLHHSLQSVVRDGQVLDLTPKEYRLLCLLAETPGHLVSRRQIIHKVWGLDFDTETNLLDVTMRRLRHKVDEPFAEKVIRTVRGAGFMLDWENRG